jgi:hypothetical protein
VVTAEGFTAFADRPRRLRACLDAYVWDGELPGFLEIVREWVLVSAEGIRRTAAAGDPAYVAMVQRGVDQDLRRAADELSDVLSSS